MKIVLCAGQPDAGGQARFRYLDMTTADNYAIFARGTDFWAVGRLTTYDQLANCMCAQAPEEYREEMNVEECAQ